MIVTPGYVQIELKEYPREDLRLRFNTCNNCSTPKWLRGVDNYIKPVLSRKFLCQI
jgi:hypothetical protein